MDFVMFVSACGKSFGPTNGGCEFTKEDYLSFVNGILFRLWNYVWITQSKDEITENTETKLSILYSEKSGEIEMVYIPQ